MSPEKPPREKFDRTTASISQFHVHFSECLCSGIGILSSVCDARGGQCPCKPGVMLKGCTECMVDYYGFSSGAGCKRTYVKPKSGLCDDRFFPKS